jgi:hypothetical protein
MTSQLGEKLILRTILEGFVTGHGFSRAANASFSVRALAPEACFLRSDSIDETGCTVSRVEAR